MAYSQTRRPRPRLRYGRIQTAEFTVNANACPIIWVLFLQSCVGNPLTAHNSTPVSGVTYKSGDGETIDCAHSRRVYACGSRSAPLFIYFDCSDEQFECVFDTSNVLAIPKAGLTLGQQYSVYGAKLTVERCQHACKEALISSRCVEGLTCSCRGGGGISDITTFFYFSRDIGVAAFYFVPDVSPEPGRDAKTLLELVPLQTFVLVSEQGFLRAPLALGRTPLKTNCQN
jgi:hypothetical protein